MDVYRALGLDVPILHLCVHLLARDGEAELVPLLAALRERCLAIARRLQEWTEEQCARYAEEAVLRLQRLGFLATVAQPSQVAAALQRELRHLATRLGSADLLPLEGPALVVCTVPELGPELAASELAPALEAAKTRLESWRAEQQLYELWFLLRGSLAFDLLNQFVAEWPASLRGDWMRGGAAESPATGLSSVASGALVYHLVYQLGDELLSGAAPELGTQTLSLSFSAGDLSYSTLRYEVMALLEQLAEQPFLLHASFWQRDPWPGEAGAAFLLRLRLPAGEVPLRQIGEALAAASPLGRERLLHQGQLFTGRRLF
ncbi:hypothetical protein [Thermogemmatispora onikobensis]|uniref:hypothetical protein n=1 Tax=Thermogemmatispora onikobensis TaxID=732234 RepID=UPI000853C81C|nr:hypothetical protein [Thermogemmatispora onikobensis]